MCHCFLHQSHSSEPDDYTASILTLSFSPGDVIELAPIPIINDAVVENSELFNLRLSSTDPAASIPTPDSQVLITDDNINDSEYGLIDGMHIQVHEAVLIYSIPLPQLLCLPSL